MDAVRYYQEKFGSDLLRLINATSDSRISIISLVPDPRAAPSSNPVASEFQRLEHKPRFLFCYYFSALLDQAIHSSLREEHTHFDRLARYPKFCGFLGSYHSLLHPATLLLIATLYTPQQDERLVTEELQELAAFFPQDYYRFLTGEYPSLTNRLNTAQEREDAAAKLFTELSNAVATLFLPRSLRPYSQAEPNLHLFDQWAASIASSINQDRRAFKDRA